MKNMYIDHRLGNNFEHYQDTGKKFYFFSYNEMIYLNKQLKNKQT